MHAEPLYMVFFEITWPTHLDIFAMSIISVSSFVTTALVVVELVSLGGVGTDTG